MQRIFAECRAARGGVDSGVDDTIGVYQAHPHPTLAGVAGLGCVLAQLRVGSGVARIGMRIAPDPTWTLVRQYLTL